MLVDSDQDDVFEFCLDQIDIDTDAKHPNSNYPALPTRPPSSPDLLDDAAFEQFDDALIPVDEPVSIGSLGKSSPTRTQNTQPRSETLAASLRLDGNKLRAMQSAFEHESSHFQDVNRQQPQWLDSLPSFPDIPKTPDKYAAAVAGSDVQDEEWGGPCFSLPVRHHRSDIAPRALCQPRYDSNALTLIGPKSSTFRSGFSSGLRLVCRGASLTSVRILRLNHDGINMKLVDIHQKAVDRAGPLETLAHSYKECPGDHWSLLIALFDPNFSSCNVHMRNALSNWLESAVRIDSRKLPTDEIQRHIAPQNRYIPGSDFWAEIATSLLGHRLGEAVTISLRHGNPKLATLIAENGSGLRGQSRQLLREQIKKWVMSGTWQTFTETCQTVYRILAGDVFNAGSDWLSNLSAKFWFNDRPNESLKSLLAPFETSSYDIRRSLLEFRADPSMPTARLFRGNPKYFDFALMWHMYDILSRRGVVLYGDAAWNLSACYAAQLEAAKHLKAALYIILAGSRHNPDASKSLLQDFLVRNWPKSHQSSLTPVQFGLPEISDSKLDLDLGSFLSAEEAGWINFITYWTDKFQSRHLYDPMVLVYTAKYGRCLSDGNVAAAMTCAMRAGLWEFAFSLFISEIAPNLILAQDLSTCDRLLSQFAAKQDSFPKSWSTAGQAILRLLLFIKGQNEPDDQLSDTEYLSSLKHGPMSNDAWKKLLLLQSAVQCMTRTKIIQRARLTSLL